MCVCVCRFSQYSGLSHSPRYFPREQSCLPLALLEEEPLHGRKWEGRAQEERETASLRASLISDWFPDSNRLCLETDGVLGFLVSWVIEPKATTAGAGLKPPFPIPAVHTCERKTLQLQNSSVGELRKPVPLKVSPARQERFSGSSVCSYRVERPSSV